MHPYTTLPADQEPVVDALIEQARQETTTNFSRQMLQQVLHHNQMKQGLSKTPTIDQLTT